MTAKEMPPWTALVTPFKTAHKNHDCSDHPTESAQKLFATLQARAALAGVVLLASTNDNGAPVYMVSRWALTRELPDLAAVQAWLDRVTGGAR
jgi:hypothetical protein